ncbi:MAG: crossover junction endodeoxyribonuclease RuvC [Chloroflexi bacterium]|nr:crossover junction endodeoxyribonuclease RuvC [Chloroflexota bacterium]
MRVLGIDPGLNVTGYGVLEAARGGARLLEGGVVRSARAGQPLEQRLQTIHAGISAPGLNVTGYGVLEAARGVACLAAAQHGVPVFTYTAGQVKNYLTGQGRASKDQMQRMVQITLKLPELPEPPDVADALAVALYHLDVAGRGWVLGPAGRVVDMLGAPP